MTDAEALARIEKARRLTNEAKCLLCRSGKADLLSRQIVQLGDIEDVLWQFTTRQERRNT